VYSMSNIIQLEENIDKCVELLMEKLKGYAAQKRTIDIAVWVQWYVVCFTLRTQGASNLVLETGMPSTSSANCSSAECSASCNMQKTMQAISML
jgi:hypothetical protein